MAVAAVFSVRARVYVLRYSPLAAHQIDASALPIDRSRSSARNPLAAARQRIASDAADSPRAS